MVCPSAEPKKERSIKEPSEVNLETMVLEAKPIDVVPSLIEQGTLCFTLSSVGLLALTASSSLSTLPWI